ncbi:MAG: Triosephosphate isomerase [Chlamydiia bacterium]|nr:Triosephosphate isomerase [Chlamydiia bacterium]MCH9618060.1 Triosephosphate isomerase [Chlamydiia bacterium]MCH9624690.1 Triosephosphate isomerase [Chlamydiia bacterium]
MKKILIANWKMNKLRGESVAFIENIVEQDTVDIAIVPPFLSIQQIKEYALSKNILIGSQNMSEYSHGAYTGEISATMLKDVLCDFVLLGHSERRKIFLENNDVISRKVERAVVEKMPFILCVGETLDERDLGQTEEVITHMLNEALSSLIGSHWDLVTIAYEPVWAIGTGKVATKEMIRSVHALIRDKLIEFSPEKGESIRILYGGSVKSENVKEIFSIDNVDGALVGGASLEALSFNQLINEVSV